MSNLTDQYVINSTFPASKVTEYMDLIVGRPSIEVFHAEEIIGKKAYVISVDECSDCQEQEHCGGYYIQAKVTGCRTTISSCYWDMYVLNNGRYKLIVPDKGESV